MSLTKTQAKILLKEHKLRCTAPRMAVLCLLANQSGPVSHSEVVQLLDSSDWNPATVYRNLVKLTDVGLARVVSHAGGMARYALAQDNREEVHDHPHFVCNDCGTVACLPSDVVAQIEVKGEWAKSVKSASLQLRGECPDCLNKSEYYRQART